MGNAAGTADGKNAVFIPEPLEGKTGRLVPFQQLYFHEGLYSQNPASVITWNIRFRDLGLIPRPCFQLISFVPSKACSMS